MYSRFNSDFSTGRYVKGENAYVSNRFRFDLAKGEAWSYGWWKFVQVGKDGVVYFNNASYSMQTSGHQTMAMNILKFHFAHVRKYKTWQKKIEMYFDVPRDRVKTVYVKEGLQDLSGAIRNRYAEMAKLEYLQTLPRFSSRQGRIDQLKKDIVELQDLQRVFGERITRLSKAQYAELKANRIASIDQSRQWDKERRERELAQAKAAADAPNVKINSHSWNFRNLFGETHKDLGSIVVSKEQLSHFIEDTRWNTERLEPTTDPVTFDLQTKRVIRAGHLSLVG